ncbi:hypothetical protein K3495_g541 [Podosphaera aphanis]|nr:hypothetical protein K3495_g541 [Podosphaera aphanis]
MSRLGPSNGDISVYLLFAVLISAVGPFQYGYHLSELNVPQDLLTCNKRAVHHASTPTTSFHRSLVHCIPMREAEFAVLSSLFVLGGFSGAVTCGSGSSRYGRLTAMRITSLFFTLGSVLETVAESVAVMAFGRFLAGVGAGATTVVVPMYLSEIAPPEKRGLFGTITQAMICLGILTSQVTGYFLNTGARWRIILGVGIGLGVLLAIGLLLLPESPTWLAVNQESALAIKILQRLRGTNYIIDEETTTWDIPHDPTERQSLLHARNTTPTLPSGTGDIQVAVPAKDQPMPVGFFDVLRTPSYRPALVAVLGIMSSQQLCGINSIIMYSVSLLHGVLPIPSTMLTILISTINFLTCLICAPLPDWIGRKRCLLLSITGMACMSFLLAVSLQLEMKLLTAIAVIFYVAFFATGLGPVPYMMASELVGQEAVGALQSWGLAANYVASILVAQCFPLLNTWMNARWGGAGSVYFVFAILGGACWAFVTGWVPETLGKKGPDEVWGREREENLVQFHLEG